MLRPRKTKIVCTVGPASRASRILEDMIRAGMDVARLNFAHGDFAGHRAAIRAIRAAAGRTGRRVAILADLPGPRIRIGDLDPDPVFVKTGDPFTLTTRPLTGDAARVSVTFTRLPRVVRRGHVVFVNDGLVRLEVLAVAGEEVRCRVAAGGELRSRKGINLPGIELGIPSFTDRDRECLAFALGEGVDAVSQSFVASAADVEAVRQAASSLGFSPFILAKIERAGALRRIDEILSTADGIMIARGDLGVEIPIEEIALAQKELMRKANLFGKPVITATQMLESMTEHPRPTRAEATDVANAVLDGTDAVMLSAESATGRFPVESVAMLSRIAEVTEPRRSRARAGEGEVPPGRPGEAAPVDLVALSARLMIDRAAPAAVIVPTLSGATARNLARFRLPVWIAAVSPRETTCRQLQFSYGVHPVHERSYPEDWNAYARKWLAAHRLEGTLVLLAEGPSPAHPERNHRLEIIDLARTPSAPRRGGRRPSRPRG